MRNINLAPNLRSTIQTTSAGGGGGRRGGGQNTGFFIGVVLSVCLDESSLLYEGDPKNIGKIRFRSYSGQDQTMFVDEQTIENKSLLKNVAYPLDRNNFKVPDPGDQIIIYSAHGDQSHPGAPDIPGVCYYYGQVISTTHNTTYNVLPYLGSSPSTTSNFPDNTGYNRFKLKLQDPASYTTINFDGKESYKVYKQLRAYQGDCILQGSFGNTIRLGSTSTVTNSPWSTAKSGNSGDPIIMLRVDNDYVTNVSESLTVENIDTDDSSIYVCSNHKISMLLSSTAKSRTWKESSGAADDVTNNQALDLTPTESQKINNYIGAQVLINSDRIVMNTRDNYLMLFGGAGVSIESGRGPVNIESDVSVTLFGEDGLYLGVPNKGREKPSSLSTDLTYDSRGYEPAVLGKRLEKLLDEFLFTIINSMTSFSVEGSTFTQDTINKLSKIKDRLPEMLSTNVYIDGISHEKGEAVESLTVAQIKPTRVTGNSTAQVAQEAESQPVQNQTVPAKTCSITTVQIPQTTSDITTPGATTNGSEATEGGTASPIVGSSTGADLVAPSAVTSSTTTVVNYDPSTLQFLTSDQFGGPEVDELITLANFGETTNTSVTEAATITPLPTANPATTTEQTPTPVCDPPADNSGTAPTVIKSGAPLQAGNVEEAINLFIGWIKAHEGFVTEPYWDVSGWRIGHGTGTITKEDNVKITLPQNTNTPGGAKSQRPIKLQKNSKGKWEIVYAAHISSNAASGWTYQIINEEASRLEGKASNMFYHPYLTRNGTNKSSIANPKDKWKNHVPLYNMIDYEDASRDLKRIAKTEKYTKARENCIWAAGWASEQDWNEVNIGWWIVCMDFGYAYGDGAWKKYNWNIRGRKYLSQKDPANFVRGLFALDGWGGDNLRSDGKSRYYNRNLERQYVLENDTLSDKDWKKLERNYSSYLPKGTNIRQYKW